MHVTITILLSSHVDDHNTTEMLCTLQHALRFLGNSSCISLRTVFFSLDLLLSSRTPCIQAALSVKRFRSIWSCLSSSCILCTSSNRGLSASILDPHRRGIPRCTFHSVSLQPGQLSSLLSRRLETRHTHRIAHGRDAFSI